MSIENYDFEKAWREDEVKATVAFPALMRKVYIWMSLALLITGLTAFYVASTPALITAILGNKILFYGLMIAEVCLVLGVSAGINKLSLSTATLLFVLYSVINGATLSVLLLVFTMASIAKVFFITAGTFGAMSLIGYTTKTDLTSMGKILMMALVGLIIASVVNMCLGSAGLDYIMSYVGVLIFVGLTAYDTQKIKNLFIGSGVSGEAGQKIALLGALTLYLDFINLFIYLLRIFGSRRD